MTPDPEDAYEVFRGKWALEVGRFVLAFGSIEGLSYAALRLLPNDPIAEPLLKAPLGQRIDVLIAVCGGGRDGERWKTLADVLH